MKAMECKLDNIIVRNEYLKDQKLIQFEIKIDVPSFTLIFEYNEDFAKKYNMKWCMDSRYDQPVLIIEHKFTKDNIFKHIPFEIKITHDIENNTFYID